MSKELYRSRAEWADVVPVPQDEGPDPVCPIAYTEPFRDAMDYFRAVVQRDERSARALQLTQHVIELAPANYTAWYYRRLVLDALPHVDWRHEVEWCGVVAQANQKNYQVWHHRQHCLLKLQLLGTPFPALEDLKHCDAMIDADSKNYHVWSYRQWAVTHHAAHDYELAFVDRCIERDVRNNSAWNQRFWLGTQLGWWAARAACEKEVEFALAQAKRAPSNESPWLYCRGVLTAAAAANNNNNTAGNASSPLLPAARLKQLAEQYLLCVPVRSLLVYVYENFEKDIDAAIAVCVECAEKVDNIHAKYWNFKTKQLQSKK